MGPQPTHSTAQQHKLPRQTVLKAAAQVASTRLWGKEGGGDRGGERGEVKMYLMKGRVGLSDW